MVEGRLKVQGSSETKAIKETAKETILLVLRRRKWERSGVSPKWEGKRDEEPNKWHGRRTGTVLGQGSQCRIHLGEPLNTRMGKRKKWLKNKSWIVRTALHFSSECLSNSPPIYLMHIIVLPGAPPRRSCVLPAGLFPGTIALDSPELFQAQQTQPVPIVQVFRIHKHNLIN